jgi:hypothetical protein
MYQPYPGSTQVPETVRPPAPSSVLNAAKVMYAGAAASLIGLAIDLTTLGATKTAIEKRNPSFSASQVNSAQHAAVVEFIAVGLIGAVVWIFLARACQNGKNWARITGTVLFGFATLDAIGIQVVPLSVALKIYTLLVWLIGLAAVILLWRRSSTAFFKETSQ